MQFGFVDTAEQSKIDFTLPADPVMTTGTLAASKRDGQLKVYIGGTNWASPALVGSIYPSGALEKDFLKLYSKQFNTIEFGPTFYGIPNPEKIDEWRRSVESNPYFRFCPRFPTAISHIKRFKNVDTQTMQFYESIRALGNHVGAILMQLPENFGFKGFEDLSSYLSGLPIDIPLFLELRNEKWFANQEHKELLFKLLHSLSFGAAISDTPGRRDVVHMQLPVPHAMVRFVGSGLDAIERKRLDAWVKRLKSWNEQGLQSVWFFMHQHELASAPKSCAYLIGRLNDELGMKIKVPVLL